MLADVKPLIRSHVTFDVAREATLDTAKQIAHEFLRSYKERREKHLIDVGTRLLKCDDKRATAEISWFNGVYHTVKFEALGNHERIAITRPKFNGAGIGLSRILERWLLSNSQFKNLRWFSKKQWRSGGPYSGTVI